MMKMMIMNLYNLWTTAMLGESEDLQVPWKACKAREHILHSLIISREVLILTLSIFNAL